MQDSIKIFPLSIKLHSVRMRSSTLQHPFSYQVTATQADDLPMMNNIRTFVGKPLATLEENDWILHTMCLLKRI